MRIHFGPPTAAAQRLHFWVRAMNLIASEIAEQRRPEAWMPTSSDYCDHLRLANVQALQGSLGAIWDVGDGSPEMLMHLVGYALLS